MAEFWLRAWMAFFEAKDWAIDAAIRALCVVFFWRHRVVPEAQSGEPMLRQLAVIRGGSWLGRRYGAVYLQHFLRPEPVNFAHIHRWAWMRSRVLSGCFIEERFAPFALGAEQQRRSELHAHIGGDFYFMDRSVVHRVAMWSKRCWTLFRMSPEQTDAWGYFRIERRGANAWRVGEMIPWREHITRRVPSLDTGKVTQ